MPVPKGTPKTPGSGRKKGTPNKSTLTAIDFFKKANFDPLEKMIKEYDESEDPKVRAMLLATLVKYRHPQLRQTELTGKDGGPMIVESVRFGPAKD